MGKKAFFVIGPESSGTRLLTRLLLANGCYGDGEHEQRIDGEIGVHSCRFKQEDLIVYRKSVPHGGGMPSIRWIVARLRAQGFEVTVLFTVRDFHCMVESNMLREHAHDPESSRQRIYSSYSWIFSELSQCGANTIIVPFEACLLHEESRWKLLSYLGITTRNTTDKTVIRDSNAKHFDHNRS